MALLEVKDLGVTFGAEPTPVQAVRGASFALDRGRHAGHRRRERLGQVGDRALDPAAAALSRWRRTRPGSIRFDGEELVGRDDRFLRTIRGRRIGMIFQEPMTSLNPLHTVERQIGEVLFVHRGLGRAEARARAARAPAAGRRSPTPSRGSAPTRTSSPAASGSG